MRSPIQFLDIAGRPLDALADTALHASSEGLEWDGVTLTAGTNTHWEADELTTDSHYLAWNVGDAPLRWDAKINGRFQQVGNDPGELWFCPAGERFTHIVDAPSRFVLVTLTPQRFAHWTGGRRLALERRYGMASAPLEHLARALTEEASRGGPNGRMFVDALGAAMAQGVAALFGDAPTERGALDARRLRRVLDVIEAHLGEDLSIERLAREAAYSPTHFARAFKAATGQAPHRHVLQRRLQRAQEHIRAGWPLAQVADELGFTDQSHFTKAFAAAFGTTPSRWRQAG